MFSMKNKVALAAALTVSATSAFATAETVTLVAKTCLSTHLKAPHKILRQSGEFQLIQTSQEGIDQLNQAKHKGEKSCGGFLNVTEAWQKNASETKGKMSPEYFLAYAQARRSNDPINFPGMPPVKPAEETKYNIRYSSDVNQLLNNITPENMWANLTHLTSYPDRYAFSDTGVAAAEWMKSTIESMAKDAGRNDVSVRLVATGRYKQPSVVVKVGKGNDAGVLLGAHIDTMRANAWGDKPGADDDGSGSVTALEVARVIINSGKTFKKPVYFAWYAAEEMGLVGSQYVVQDFEDKNIPVAAVMHFDMTGYRYHNEPTMWLMDDNVDKTLSQFTESLITTYVKESVKHSRCGYACSDHASWYQHGIKTTMPAEAAFEHSNPNMHSSQDTMDKLSLDHMTNYAKLGVAFITELAEPVS